MQQTENLKLNLIETGDPISPNPLNENAQKLEGAIAALGGTAAGLGSRVTALEARKMVVGTYIGTDKEHTVLLGFTPVAVLISESDIYNTRYCALSVTGSPVTNSGTGKEEITIVEGGFRLPSSISKFNQNTRYNYIAFK